MVELNFEAKLTPVQRRVLAFFIGRISDFVSRTRIINAFDVREKLILKEEVYFYILFSFFSLSRE